MLDLFIQKSKGTALLSELVANSLEEIERFRLKQYNDYNKENDSNNEEENVDINEGLQTYAFVDVKNGTVDHEDANNQFGTIKQ